MRFERVHVVGFGPLADAELVLAPGLNVVYGPNEAGKSTWHAALYAALCGQRRGRGQPRREERDFADRHRPWSGRDWAVDCRIRLDGGRVIEIWQDLGDGLNFRATDQLGRDIASDLLHDGMPDGASLLGLDRVSFFSTACVRQADILGIVDDAARLQDYLQRAAATAAADTSAAVALERLKEFRAENVGLDRANTTKPLRRAKIGLSSARQALEDGQAAHQEYVAAGEAAARLADAASAAEHASRVVEALQARNATAQLRARVDRASELATRRQSEPVTQATSDELAQRVASALDAWDSRPPAPNLPGESSNAVRAQLGALPPLPNGDRRSHLSVDAARREFELAGQARELHEANRPADPEFPSTGGLDEDALRSLTSDLAVGSPSAVAAPALVAPLAGRARPGGRALGVAIGALLVVLGIAIAAAASPILGVLLVVAGLAGGAVLALRREQSMPRVAPVVTAPTTVATGGPDDAAQRRIRAAQHAGRLGLPVDPAALLRTADALAEAKRDQRLLDRWQAKAADLAGKADTKQAAFARALGARGVAVDGPVAEADLGYQTACQERADTAQAAGRGVDLEQRLSACEQLEQTAAEFDRQRAEAERRLKAAGRAADVSAEWSEELADALGRWLAERADAVDEDEAARREWTELQTLLDGRELGDLRQEHRKLDRRATLLAEGLDRNELDAVKAEDLEGEAERRRGAAKLAREDTKTAAGRLQALAERMPSVAEAEEAIARADRELERVERLARTVDVTTKLLREAQDRVHRDIAPVLNKSVAERLPAVTGGRYREVIVDPQTLTLQVRQSDGSVRDARFLSHGTAEQIYLLLRVAMAERLATSGETCPLLLDDVTAQSDRVRTKAILELLVHVATDRQVVLFTQEDLIRDWASQHLDGEQDQLQDVNAQNPIDRQGRRAPLRRRAS